MAEMKDGASICSKVEGNEPCAASSHRNNQIQGNETDENQLRQNNELFEQVLSKVMDSIEKSEKEKIHQKLIKAFQNADSDCFRNSKDFESFLHIISNKISEDPENVYIHIYELKNELAAHRQYSYSSLNGANKISLSESANNDASDSSNQSYPRLTSVDKRRVLKLEKVMKKLEKKIIELKNKDMSVDDLDEDCTPYVLLDKYVNKFNEAWKLYCKLTSRGTGTSRPVQKFIKYNGTAFPEVNKSIERFVNRNKNSFPDFCDILNDVKKVNELKNLSMRPHKCHELAVEIFEDIGKILKSRRKVDLSRNAMFLLPPPHFDPAETDPNLQEQLAAHAEIGKNKLNEVFSKYSNIQVQENLGPDEDGEECESDDNGDVNNQVQDSEHDNEINEESGSDTDVQEDEKLKSNDVSSSQSSEDEDDVMPERNEEEEECVERISDSILRTQNGHPASPENNCTEESNGLIGDACSSKSADDACSLKPSSPQLGPDLAFKLEPLIDIVIRGEMPPLHENIDIENSVEKQSKESVNIISNGKSSNSAFLKDSSDNVITVDTSKVGKHHFKTHKSSCDNRVIVSNHIEQSKNFLQKNNSKHSAPSPKAQSSIIDELFHDDEDAINIVNSVQVKNLKQSHVVQIQQTTSSSSVTVKRKIQTTLMSSSSSPVKRKRFNHQPIKHRTNMFVSRSESSSLKLVKNQLQRSGVELVRIPSVLQKHANKEPEVITLEDD